MAQGDLGSLRAGDLEPAPADHVLPQVKHPNARLGLVQRDRFQGLHHPDRVNHLRHERAAGGRHLLRPQPFSGVKAGLVPAGHFPGRIIFLAVVFVIGPNRPPRGDPPVRVAHHFRGSSIRVFDLHLEQELGIPVAHRARRHLRARRVEPAVAQDDAGGVFPRPELRRHVVGHVAGALGIVRQRRRQDVVADFAAIEVKLAQAQPANVGRCPLDVLFDGKLPAQHPRRQPAAFRSADFPPRRHARRAQLAGRHPAGFGKALFLPAGGLGGGAQPTGIGHHHQGLALGKLHPQARHQPGRIRIRAGIGHRHGQLVVARPQVPGHFDHGGGVEIARHPDLPAIDVEHAAVIRRPGQRGPPHHAVRRQGEPAPEVAGADGRGFFRLAFGEPNPLRVAQHFHRHLARGRLVQPDPPGVPIRGLEQAHRPARRRAPGRGFAAFVPDPHLPIAGLARGQRAAMVADVNGLIRHHLAAVPKVAPVGRQLPRAAGHQDLPGALLLAADGGLVRAQHPAQAGLGDINSQRVLQVFASQLADDDRRSTGGHQPQGQEQPGTGG